MKSLRVTLIVLSMLLVIVCSSGCGKKNVEDGNQNSQNSLSSAEVFDEWSEEQANKTPYPWEEADAKKPADYTWEEFNNLSAEHQIAFQNAFENVEAFDEWLNKAQEGEHTYPWDEEGAKKPADYTWEEFNNLSAENQIAFQNAFEKFEDFENWLSANEPR